MKKVNNVVAQKIVGADTKNNNLALRYLGSYITMADLRKVLKIPDSQKEPEYVFDILIETKSICTRKHLKAMFNFGNGELRHVFYEGRRRYERGYLITREAYDILTWDFIWDYKTQERIPIVLSPAQQKLRNLLGKRIKLERLDDLMNELENTYGLYLDNEIYMALEKNYHITEEELLDALNTYQAEHQA